MKLMDGCLEFLDPSRFGNPRFSDSTPTPTLKKRDANLRKDLDGRNYNLGCGANHPDRRPEGCGPFVGSVGLVSLA